MINKSCEGWEKSVLGKQLEMIHRLDYELKYKGQLFRVKIYKKKNR